MNILRENFKLIKNPNHVNYIKTVKAGDAYALVASLITGLTVPLTQFRSGEFYNDSPILEIKKMLPEDYFSNFFIDDMEIFALNTRNVSKFEVVPTEKREVSKLVAYVNVPYSISPMPKQLCLYDTSLAEETKEGIYEKMFKSSKNIVEWQ